MGLKGTNWASVAKGAFLSVAGGEATEKLSKAKSVVADHLPADTEELKTKATDTTVRVRGLIIDALGKL